MKRRILKIVLVSSEVTPFAKTGGLADVCGALPVALEQLGHEVTVIMPAFRQALECGQPRRRTGYRLTVPLKSQLLRAEVWQSSLPTSGVAVLMVDYPPYFDRNGLYRDEHHEYPDNCERFVFFCRAVLQLIAQLPDTLDILHCNDWQTGLIPAYLEIELRSRTKFKSIASLLTIHNLAYQGLFWRHDMPVTGLDWRFFNWRQMEYYGKLNLLKTGIVFANGINTVSPTYAAEIQTPLMGCGLDGVLRERPQGIQGILNGIDHHVWEPTTDHYLACNYDYNSWRHGKAIGKAALQESLNLPLLPDILLVAIIGRLADQKGWDMLAPVIERWAETRDVQWVILGTGERHYERAIQRLGATFPDRVAVRLEFSEVLAHRIEAGADLFLMPSHYEPCGLNQLYSLRYGTVPLVRETGGLADTVVDATTEAVQTRRATGFSFHDANSQALEETLQRASKMFESQPDVWQQLVVTGMKQDWSWTQSARSYGQLYNQLTSAKRRDAMA